MLNKKYIKFFNKQDITELQQLELIYSTSTLGSMALGTFLMFKRNFNFRLLRIYLGIHLIISSRVIGMYLIKNRMEKIKAKIPKEKTFKMMMCDLFDETLIPDWKTYLYYFKIL